MTPGKEKRMSGRTRKCNKEFEVSQLPFCMIGGEMLNELLMTSLKTNLISTRQWFLLSDGSLL